MCIYERERERERELELTGHPVKLTDRHLESTDGLGEVHVLQNIKRSLIKLAHNIYLLIFCSLHTYNVVHYHRRLKGLEPLQYLERGGSAPPLQKKTACYLPTL